jgi:hypothetical protein
VHCDVNHDSLFLTLNLLIYLRNLMIYFNLDVDSSRISNF